MASSADFSICRWIAPWGLLRHVAGLGSLTTPATKPVASFVGSDQLLIAAQDGDDGNLLIGPILRNQGISRRGHQRGAYPHRRREDAVTRSVARRSGLEREHHAAMAPIVGDLHAVGLQYRH